MPVISSIDKTPIPIKLIANKATPATGLRLNSYSGEGGKCFFPL